MRSFPLERWFTLPSCKKRFLHDNTLANVTRPPPADISENSLWKEIRGYKHYVLIGSELRNHGIQIVDMAKLLTITLAEAPVAWTNEKDVESIFKGLPGRLSLCQFQNTQRLTHVSFSKLAEHITS